MLSEKKERMLARISRLAKKYGPFVRFFPDGKEGADDDEVVLDKAIASSEKAARTPEEQKAIDDARLNEQQLEQERSNTTRANETARQTQTDLDAAKAENENLKDELEAAKAKADEAGIESVELNEDDYQESPADLAIVKAIKSTNAKLAAKDKQIANLEKKASGYETKARTDAVLTARNEAYSELLSDLDEEYGADCRNEAVKQFKQLGKDGKIPQNKTAKATRIMEKCYKDAKAAKAKADTHADKKKPSLSLDSGSGGGSSPNLSGTEIKEGSLDEVDAQVAKTELGARKS